MVWIQPGKPTQSTYIESFSERFRCLNEHWFVTLDPAGERMARGAAAAMRPGRTVRCSDAHPPSSRRPSGRTDRLQPNAGAISSPPRTL
ncbi:MAG: transposase [Dokdonella sp.]|nr:MAG: transposase [Dokdonella sp.]